LAELRILVISESALSTDSADRFHLAQLIEPKRTHELGLISVRWNTLSIAAAAFSALTVEQQTTY